MDYILGFIAFFLGLFIYMGLAKILESMFPKLMAPAVMPTDGSLLKFYLYKSKPILFILIFSGLFCSPSYLTFLFLVPKIAGIWKIFILLAVGFSLLFFIWNTIQYLGDIFWDYGLKDFNVNSLNNKYFAYFWKLLGIAFILGFLLPRFEIGLPYSLYIFQTVLIIFFLVLGIVALEVRVKLNREERAGVSPTKDY